MPKLVKAMSAPDRFNLLTSLIGYLIRNNPVAKADVAKHFGVDEATIESALRTILVTEDTSPYRTRSFYIIHDQEILDEDGIITLTVHPMGGRGTQDDAPRLDTREAAALAMGLQYLKTLPEFASAAELDKLIELMGKGQGFGSSAPAIVLHHGKIDEDAAVCRTAIIEGKRIRFDYINQKGESASRLVDPIRLDPRENHWYLHGWCLDNNALRKFRLDRMRNAIVLEEAIGDAALSVIDLDDRVYTESETDIDVTVSVLPEAYALLGEYQQVGEPDKKSNGEVTAVIRVGYLPNLGRLIARYGGAAKVLEPVEARALVRDFALGVLGHEPLERQEIQEG